MSNYIICAVQNNSNVHTVAKTIMQQVAYYFSAEVLVINTRYNPKFALGYAPEEQDGDYWEFIQGAQVLTDDAVVDGWRIAAHTNVLPTAKNPFASMQELAQREEGGIIIAHPKQDNQVFPSLGNSRPKAAYSTGYLTNPNYSGSRAGMLGESRHKLGFILIHNGKPHMLEVREGCIMFNGLKFDGLAITEVHASAIIPGDFHAEKLTELDVAAVKRHIYGVRDYIDENTKFFWHDLIDFSVKNHHQKGSNIHLLTCKSQDIRASLSRAFDKWLGLINALHIDEARHFIVESNHNEAFFRWIDEADFKREQPENARLLLNMLEAVKEGEHPLEYFYLKLYDSEYKLKRVTFGRHDSSEVVAGHELAHHGHRGANGARGSAPGFEAFSVPMVKGHDHTPRKNGDVVTVGVCGFNMGYNKGPSSWLRRHVILWPNGQVQFFGE